MNLGLIEVGWKDQNGGRMVILVCDGECDWVYNIRGQYDMNEGKVDSVYGENFFLVLVEPSLFWLESLNGVLLSYNGTISET